MASRSPKQWWTLGLRGMAMGANMYQKELRFLTDIAADVNAEDGV